MKIINAEAGLNAIANELNISRDSEAMKYLDELFYTFWIEGKDKDKLVTRIISQSIDTNKKFNKKLFIESVDTIVTTARIVRQSFNNATLQDSRNSGKDFKDIEKKTLEDSGKVLVNLCFRIKDFNLKNHKDAEDFQNIFAELYNQLKTATNGISPQENIVALSGKCAGLFQKGDSFDIMMFKDVVYRFKNYLGDMIVSEIEDGLYDENEASKIFEQVQRLSIGDIILTTPSVITTNKKVIEHNLKLLKNEKIGNLYNLSQKEYDRYGNLSLNPDVLDLLSVLYKQMSTFAIQPNALLKTTNTLDMQLNNYAQAVHKDAKYTPMANDIFNGYNYHYLSDFKQNRLEENGDKVIGLLSHFTDIAGVKRLIKKNISLLQAEPEVLRESINNILSNENMKEDEKISGIQQLFVQNHSSSNKAKIINEKSNESATVNKSKLNIKSEYRLPLDINLLNEIKPFFVDESAFDYYTNNENRVINTQDILDKKNNRSKKTIIKIDKNKPNIDRIETIPAPEVSDIYSDLTILMQLGEKIDSITEDCQFITDAFSNDIEEDINLAIDFLTEKKFFAVIAKEAQSLEKKVADFEGKYTKEERSVFIDSITKIKKTIENASNVSNMSVCTFLQAKIENNKNRLLSNDAVFKKVKIYQQEIIDIKKQLDIDTAAAKLGDMDSIKKIEDERESYFKQQDKQIEKKTCSMLDSLEGLFNSLNKNLSNFNSIFGGDFKFFKSKLLENSNTLEKTDFTQTKKEALKIMYDVIFILESIDNYKFTIKPYNDGKYLSEIKRKLKKDLQKLKLFSAKFPSEEELSKITAKNITKNDELFAWDVKEKAYTDLRSMGINVKTLLTEKLYEVEQKYQEVLDLENLSNEKIIKFKLKIDDIYKEIERLKTEKNSILEKNKKTEELMSTLLPFEEIQKLHDEIDIFEDVLQQISNNVQVEHSIDE